MSIFDKLINAVTPAEGRDARIGARAEARAVAGNTGWLDRVLGHHLQIEEAFAALQRTEGASGRRAAHRRLAALLTAHSIAEESVIYPALALTGQEGHADHAYVEQSKAKIEMAVLEALDPMSQDYVDKVEEIRNAVAHHVYEEESAWFPELRRQGDAAMQAGLTRRYKEEFERYLGTAASTQ